LTKSLFSKEYAALLSLLRVAREQAGLSQAQVAKRLGQTQSFVSKCERGERRLDVVEARAFCMAIGVPFMVVMSKLDSAAGTTCCLNIKGAK